MDYSLYGIGVATQAMAAAQAAMDTMGNNLANANTDGYSRQRVEQVPSQALNNTAWNTPVRLAQLGGGVQVTQISRIRDTFLDGKIRTENATLGANQTVSDQVNQVQALFQEPGDTGLASTMTKFFNSWDQLATNPESSAARSQVREQGLALAGTFNALSTNLTRLRNTEDSQIQSMVSDVNGYTQQISDLNQLIAAATAAGTPPNSLMDQRDLALEKLSKLVNVQTEMQSDGKVLVYVKGMGLVNGDRSEQLSTQPNAEALSDVTFRGSVANPQDLGGSMGALFQSRDQIIGRSYSQARPAGTAGLPDTPNGMLYQIDMLSNQLAQMVNYYHRQGTDLNGTTGGGGTPAAPAGTEFFVNNNAAAATTNDSFIGAQGLMVNQAIQNGPLGLNLIVAGRPTSGTDPNTGLPYPASTPGPGDNTVAQIISGMRSLPGGSPPFNAAPYTTSSSKFGPTENLNDYYRTFLSNLGVTGQSAERIATNQANLVHQLTTQREATSGVSIDEEMSNMVRFQHAYEASAKVLSIMDQMLNKIINGTGAG